MSRTARGAVAASSLAALAALLVGGRLAEGVFAAACVLFPVALIALGAARRERLGRPLAVVLAALLSVLALSFLGIFLLRGQVLEAPWLAGLPLATVLLLGGVWLVPLALVGLAYALTFDRHGLTPEDLERLRRAVGPSAAPTHPSPHPPTSPFPQTRPDESDVNAPSTSPLSPAKPDASPHPPTSPEEAGGAGRLEGRGPSRDDAPEVAPADAPKGAQDSP